MPSQRVLLESKKKAEYKKLYIILLNLYIMQVRNPIPEKHMACLRSRVSNWQNQDFGPDLRMLSPLLDSSWKGERKNPWAPSCYISSEGKGVSPRLVLTKLGPLTQPAGPLALNRRNIL